MLYKNDLFTSNFLGGAGCLSLKSLQAPPVRYLGIIINSVSMNFEIPKDKQEFIIEEATFSLKTKFFPVKRLASWVGKLQSLRLAICPIVSIMCRALHNVINLAFSSISLDHHYKFEVTWWYNI